MFLTNNSLCVLMLCIMFRKIITYLAPLPGISANSNENYRRYNFQSLTNINVKFPENTQRLSKPSQQRR